MHTNRQIDREIYTYLPIYIHICYPDTDTVNENWTDRENHIITRERGQNDVYVNQIPNFFGQNVIDMRLFPITLLITFGWAMAERNKVK